MSCPVDQQKAMMICGLRAQLALVNEAIRILELLQAAAPSETPASETSDSRK